MQCAAELFELPCFFHLFAFATAAMPATDPEDIARLEPSVSELWSSKPWKGFFEQNFPQELLERGLLGIENVELYGISTEFAPNGPQAA